MRKEIKKRFDSLFSREDIVVLGLESSCDETAAAVTMGNRVLSSITASQADIHQRFGGVVPEVASRNHTLMFTEVIDDALKAANKTLDEIDAIAVTSHPGLIGSLLVGVSTAKALCLAKNIPLISVNHIEAHICANYAVFNDNSISRLQNLNSGKVEDLAVSSEESMLKPPFLALVASGGHTSIIDVTTYNEYTVIGRTLDDAIGEAFDKVARVLGLPYPGGPNVDRYAKEGQNIIEFFKKKGVKKDYSLSYSGLKTAVVNYLHNLEQKGLRPDINDVCASFSFQAVDMLVSTLFKAADDLNHDTIAVAGGVAANSYLRKMLNERANGKRVVIPPVSLCTDNAVMVALRGFYSAREGKNLADFDLKAASTM